MSLFKNKNQQFVAEPAQAVPMLRQATEVKPALTVICSGMNVKGVFSGKGDLQVDGTLEGNITIEGATSVSEGAEVSGDITCNIVTVSGQVRGNIISKKLEITATGKVWGDLQVDRLLQHEGGFHNGRSDMTLPANGELSEEAG